LNKIVLFFIFLLLPSCSTPGITKIDIDTIVKKVEMNKEQEFGEFLSQVKSIAPLPRVTLESISLFQSKNKLNKDQSNEIFRLLAVFTRMRYKDSIIDLLGKMVSIPTFKKDGPQYKNPQIIKFGRLMKKVSSELGLKFRNVDNRVFEFELAGSTKEAFGIYTHADVVPVIAKNWILKDGTKLNPFKMKIIGNKIYGRGTEDDKASIAAALYAMKSIKDAKIPLRRSIRLMIETTEETSGEGFEYYKKNNTVPEYNIVLDSSYPAVIAEKAYGSVRTFFTIRLSKGNSITKISSGTAGNQIPSDSIATVSCENDADASQLIEALNGRAASFVKSNGSNFSIKISRVKLDVFIQVIGASAHSSGPQNGVNPVSRILVFLHQNKELFSSNHFLDAAQYSADNWGLGYYGEKLGIGYKDDFMGPFTNSVTFMELKNGKLNLTVNIRAPKPKDTSVLKQEIIAKLEEYKKSSKLNFNINVYLGNWMHRNPKGKWLDTLLNIYHDSTGLDSTPVSSSGGTTAKQLPNGINFGPSMPGQIYKGHATNEYKLIENLEMDTQMFTEMLIRIGNLQNMR
jgi:predicted dipeptidase